MCGIAGAFHYRTGRAAQQDELDRLLAPLAHRGPNDRGVFVEGAVGLGHQRLSIIDLGSGHQPMESACGRYVIVFNGEIYNYRELRADLLAQGYAFQTHSDTEVILALYAQQVASPPTKLRGMFAYALYDRQEKSLRLVRDRLGQKPLFYLDGPDGIRFASEIKSLLPWMQRRANPQALWDFLSLGYLPGQECAFEEVSQVPPATEMLFGASVEESVYWQMASAPAEPLSEDQWAQRLFEGFSKAVDYRLEADVPIGLYLSSGLDSNAVMECIHQTRPELQIKTYTAHFNEKGYDESDQSARFAGRLGYENYLVGITPEQVKSCFADVVAKADNLHANPAMFAHYFLAQRAAQDLRVVLTGGGGDELLLGYPTYLADRYLTYARALPKGAARFARKLLDLAPASHGKLSASYKAKKFLDGLGLEPGYAHYFWRTIFTEDDKARLMPGSSGMKDTGWSYAAFEGALPERSRLENYAYQDLKVWWANMGLYQSDVMGMSHSLEVRTPMMDHDFVELCFAVPEALKLKGRTGKHLFRKAVSANAKLDLNRMKKLGFHVPLAGWFAGPLKSWVEELLSPERLGALEFLSGTEVRRLMDEHFTRKADRSWHLINLLVLVEWYHQYILGQHR